MFYVINVYTFSSVVADSNQPIIIKTKCFLNLLNDIAYTDMFKFNSTSNILKYRTDVMKKCFNKAKMQILSQLKKCIKHT